MRDVLRFLPPAAKSASPPVPVISVYHTFGYKERRKAENIAIRFPKGDLPDERSSFPPARAVPRDPLSGDRGTRRRPYRASRRRQNHQIRARPARSGGHGGKRGHPGASDPHQHGGGRRGGGTRHRRDHPGDEDPHRLPRPRRRTLHRRPHRGGGRPVLYRAVRRHDHPSGPDAGHGDRRAGDLRLSGKNAGPDPLLRLRQQRAFRRRVPPSDEQRRRQRRRDRQHPRKPGSGGMRPDRPRRDPFRRLGLSEGGRRRFFLRKARRGRAFPSGLTLFFLTPRSLRA